MPLKGGRRTLAKIVSIEKRLDELCISIIAHCRLDYEITISGNGTNPSEAANVAYAILDIVHGDGRAWVKKNEKAISTKIRLVEMGIAG